MAFLRSGGMRQLFAAFLAALSILQDARTPVEKLNMVTHLKLIGNECAVMYSQDGRNSYYLSTQSPEAGERSEFVSQIQVPDAGILVKLFVADSVLNDDEVSTTINAIVSNTSNPPSRGRVYVDVSIPFRKLFHCCIVRVHPLHDLENEYDPDRYWVHGHELDLGTDSEVQVIGSMTKIMRCHIPCEQDRRQMACIPDIDLTVWHLSTEDVQRLGWVDVIAFLVLMHSMRKLRVNTRLLRSSRVARQSSVAEPRIPDHESSNTPPSLQVQEEQPKRVPPEAKHEASTSKKGSTLWVVANALKDLVSQSRWEDVVKTVDRLKDGEIDIYEVAWCKAIRSMAQAVSCSLDPRKYQDLIKNLDEQRSLLRHVYKPYSKSLHDAIAKLKAEKPDPEVLTETLRGILGFDEPAPAK